MNAIARKHRSGWTWIIGAEFGELEAPCWDDCAAEEELRELAAEFGVTEVVIDDSPEGM